MLLPHESSTPLTRLPASLPPSAIPGKGPTAQPADPAAWLCPAAAKEVGEDLDAVWLYGPRVRGEPPQDDSELQLVVLLRPSSRSDRVTALELLWQAALAEGASESYVSIRIADRASPERRRAMDELLAREVELNGIALFARSEPAPGGARKPTSGEAAAES